VNAGFAKTLGNESPTAARARRIDVIWHRYPTPRSKRDSKRRTQHTSRQDFSRISREHTLRRMSRLEQHWSNSLPSGTTADLWRRLILVSVSTERRPWCKDEA
jgi:hypothetical protein